MSEDEEEIERLKDIADRMTRASSVWALAFAEANEALAAANAENYQFRSALKHIASFENDENGLSLKLTGIAKRALEAE